MANEIGPSWTIGVAAIFRFFLAVGWVFVRQAVPMRRISLA